MVSPTSRFTSRRIGDQKQRTQPRYMSSTEASRAKHVDHQPTTDRKRSAPKKNPSTSPQSATKAPAFKSTVSPRTSAKTHTSKDIATKTAERPANEVPKSTIETPAPRDEWYSAPTCSSWSFLECSPAPRSSSSPLPAYQEAYIRAPVYKRQESSATRSSSACAVLGTQPESLTKPSPKALTKPKSKLETAKIDVPFSQMRRFLGTPDDLASQILEDINDIMQTIGIDIYAI